MAGWRIGRGRLPLLFRGDFLRRGHLHQATLSQFRKSFGGHLFDTAVGKKHLTVTIDNRAVSEYGIGFEAVQRHAGAEVCVTLAGLGVVSYLVRA